MLIQSSFAALVGDLDRVGQRDGLEDGPEFVKPVRAFVKHAQIEIGFGQRTKPDLVGHVFRVGL